MERVSLNKECTHNASLREKCSLLYSELVISSLLFSLIPHAKTPEWVYELIMSNERMIVQSYGEKSCIYA